MPVVGCSTKANQNPLYVYPRRRSPSAAISTNNTCVARSYLLVHTLLRPRTYTPIALVQRETEPHPRSTQTHKSPSHSLKTPRLAPVLRCVYGSDSRYADNTPRPRDGFSRERWLKPVGV